MTANPFAAFFHHSHAEWHFLLEGDGLGDRQELEKQYLQLFGVARLDVTQKVKHEQSKTFALRRRDAAKTASMSSNAGKAV